ncbi:DUF4192 family protein [Gulosibacter chungangensis]|uniref:DUF4192 family protein n=1 Tax=Gulosibacter chungangensis TaxID=979746 RepID=A0A7J5BC87_9MICO|nr:DUF4192 family protein [Gulosibacter chungangensis]KAB1643587.1 DUF4192 family protein [Gulosibacter chungangensis]
MNQTKRIRSALDILNTVPEMVGYLPQNSLVILPLTNGHGRACIRMDLPARESSVGVEEYTLHVLRQVMQLPDANEVFLVVYSDANIEDSNVPFADLQYAVCEGLDHFGIRIKGVLTRAANGWSSLDGGHSGPLEELQSAAQARVPASFEEFAAIAPANEIAQDNLAFALQQFELLGLELDLPTAIFAWEKMLAFRTQLEPESLLANQAILAATLREDLLTECLLAHAAYGTDVSEELERVWRALDADEEQEVDGLITDRLETEPVDLPRVTEGIALLRELIGAFPESELANGYAALAWLEWARGSSSLASHFARGALTRDQSHPLALAVSLAADGGVSPGWIRQVGVTGGFTEEDFEELLGAGQ